MLTHARDAALYNWSPLRKQYNGTELLLKIIIQKIFPGMRENLNHYIWFTVYTWEI